MDDESRGNPRRRARQIYRENDRETNRRNLTNEAVNEPHNNNNDDDDDDEQLPLSLSLGPISSSSSSSQIPPLRLAPPSPFDGPMTTWQSPRPHFMMTSLPPPMPYSTWPFLSPSSLSNSLQQTGSRGFSSTPIQPPPLSYFPASVYAPPPNETPEPPVTRSITAPVRSSRSQSTTRNQKSDMIAPPFPWATNVRGEIHSLEYLESNEITTITGDVQCRHCEQVYQISYNLRERFAEVEKIFVLRKRIMRERAPPMWTNPEPRRCELCDREKAVKPVIAERKSQINWLFLLLGQTLGHCTLEQLKNFCKHSKSHRTGAKDRVLYLTYLGLCKMLQPNRDLFKRETGFSR